MFPGAQMLNDQLQNLTLNQSRSTGQSKEDKNKLPSLYVGNLPKENFFDLDFYKLFSSKGYKVKSAKVVLHRRTSKPFGYGYL
jgi:RNA recognition motif-containing protein